MSPRAFSKSFSLGAITPRGKTHNKELNSSSKHVSLHSSGKAMWCGVVPLWLWFVPNATKWHTVMTCQGQPFCSQTLTQAFQRQPFIPESTDHSEIMLVVRSQVGNVQSVCLETQHKFSPKFTNEHKELLLTSTYYSLVLCLYKAKTKVT